MESDSSNAISYMSNRKPNHSKSQSLSNEIHVVSSLFNVVFQHEHRSTNYMADTLAEPSCLAAAPSAPLPNLQKPPLTFRKLYNVLVMAPQGYQKSPIYFESYMHFFICGPSKNIFLHSGPPKEEFLGPPLAETPSKQGVDQRNTPWEAFVK